MPAARLIVSVAFLWMVTTTSQLVDLGSEFPLDGEQGVSEGASGGRAPASSPSPGFSPRRPKRGPTAYAPAPDGPGRVLIRTEEVSIYNIYKMTRHFALSYNGGRFSCRTSGVPQHEVKVRNLSSLRSPVAGDEVPKGCRSVVTWGSERFCQDGARNPVVRDLLEACRSR